MLPFNNNYNLPDQNYGNQPIPQYVYPDLSDNMMQYAWQPPIQEMVSYAGYNATGYEAGYNATGYEAGYNATGYDVAGYDATGYETTYDANYLATMPQYPPPETPPIAPPPPSEIAPPPPPPSSPTASPVQSSYKPYSPSRADADEDMEGADDPDELEMKLLREKNDRLELARKEQIEWEEKERIREENDREEHARRVEAENRKKRKAGGKSAQFSSKLKRVELKAFGNEDNDEDTKDQLTIINKVQTENSNNSASISEKLSDEMIQSILKTATWVSANEDKITVLLENSKNNPKFKFLFEKESPAGLKYLEELQKLRTQKKVQQVLSGPDLPVFPSISMQNEHIQLQLQQRLNSSIQEEAQRAVRDMNFNMQQSLLHNAYSTINTFAATPTGYPIPVPIPITSVVFPPLPPGPPPITTTTATTTTTNITVPVPVPQAQLLSQSQSQSQQSPSPIISVAAATVTTNEAAGSGGSTIKKEKRNRWGPPPTTTTDSTTIPGIPPITTSDGPMVTPFLPVLIPSSLPSLSMSMSVPIPIPMDPKMAAQIREQKELQLLESRIREAAARSMKMQTNSGEREQELYKERLRQYEELANLEDDQRDTVEQAEENGGVIDGGTWEHRKRAKEMLNTAAKNLELTMLASGKHHMADFLPKEELDKFLNKADAITSGKTIETESDFSNFKIEENNIGFQMLQKAGWSAGEGLGADSTGIAEPINMSGSSEVLGIGVQATHEVNQDDTAFDQYRKRMMLAYRFRPNPLNNPRRDYY
eukprot:gene9651-20065_t